MITIYLRTSQRSLGPGQAKYRFVYCASTFEHSDASEDMHGLYTH